jgi:hypothetical protein
LETRGRNVGRVDVVFPDELETRFRMEVARRHGGRKGSILKAMTEAVELWIGSGDVADKLAMIVKDRARSPVEKRLAIGNVSRLGKRGFGVLADLAADSHVDRESQQQALSALSILSLQKNLGPPQRLASTRQPRRRGDAHR